MDSCVDSNGTVHVTDSLLFCILCILVLCLCLLILLVIIKMITVDHYERDLCDSL